MTSGPRSGTRIGEYSIGDELGRGGMGVVYRATHSGGHVVALKLMLPELSANDDFRERFVREAELAPGLDHPHIVPVYESGEAGGELFIAMELIEGCDLKTLIRQQGPLPPKRSLEILSQAAEALDAAHEMVIVHRDVKPQNILVSPRSEGERDHVYLTDFGLTRPVAAESTASRTGQIFGSIQYMSPEQIEDLPADGRADVYSLACVAYECLTGKIPFERANEIAVIWAHIHENPPRVTEARPELPGGLDDVIRQGMAKHPDDRYLTCGELIADLQAGSKKTRRNLVPMQLRPLVARIPRQKTEREVWAPNFFPELTRVRKLANRPNWPRVATATAALLMAPILIAQVTHPQGVVGAAGSIQQAAGDILDLDPGAGPAAEGSPAPRPSKMAGGERARRGARTGPPSLEEPLVGGLTDNPNTDALAIRPRGKTERKPIALPPALADTKVVFSTWRHAGSNKSVTGGEIYVMNADGTGLERLTFTDPVQQEAYPTISPDGDRVVFASSLEPDQLDLYLLEIATGRTTQLTSTRACEWGPKWSPDGAGLVFSRSSSCSSLSSAYHVWALDLETGSERNLTAQASDSGFWAAAGGGWGAAWSPSGRRIVLTLSDGRLYTMDRLGGDLRLLGDGIDGWSSDWCPGGSIVFARSTGIWRFDLRTQRLRQLTVNDAQYGDGYPSCSPDGTKVVFETFREGHWQVYMVNADGKNEVNITRSPSGEHHPDWQGSS